SLAVHGRLPTSAQSLTLCSNICSAAVRFPTPTVLSRILYPCFFTLVLPRHQYTSLASLWPIMDATCIPFLLGLHLHLQPLSPLHFMPTFHTIISVFLSSLHQHPPTHIFSPSPPHPPPPSHTPALPLSLYCPPTSLDRWRILIS
ncbi:hypothetical protein PHLGIDRAFT_296112, partial [Phlebiopsis gigantea 11061_1 CR5-6]